MTYGDRKYNHETRSLRRTDIVHGISLQSLNPLILRDFLDLGVFWRILRGFLGLCRLARARGASLRLCRHDDREEKQIYFVAKWRYSNALQARFTDSGVWHGSSSFHSSSTASVCLLLLVAHSNQT